MEDAAFCSMCGARAPARDPEPEMLVAAAYHRRVVAWLIDATIVFGIPIAAAAILIAQSTPPGEDAGQQGTTGIGFLLVLVAPAYSAILHRYWHGQTIGKRLLRIRVVTRTGGRISLGQSFGRSYLRMAFFVAVWVPWIVDSLWPLSNLQRRSLHDFIAGTVVVAADVRGVA